MRSENLLAVAALLILAQPAPGQPPEQPQPVAKPMTVSGVVLDSRTGQPLKRAAVTLSLFTGLKQDQRRVMTGVDGRFHFTNATSAAMRVRAERLGYATGNTERNGESEGDWLDCVIKLDPLATITGKVTDANGDALTGIAIQALQLRTEKGVRSMRVHASFQTNDLGEYRLWELQPGRYLLKALGRRGMRLYVGGGPGASTDSEAFGPVYFPDSGEASSATVLTLAPGDEFKADFRLPAHPGFRISGRIAGLSATWQTQVRLIRPDGEEVGALSSINSENGSFAIEDVAPGDYLLSVIGDQEAESKWAGSYVRVKDSDVTGLMLEMKPQPEITFELEIDGPRPVNSQVPAVRVQLIQTSGETKAARNRITILRPQAAAQKVRIPPGRYVVVADCDGGYVAGIMHGETDLLAAGFRVSDDSSSMPVKVTVKMGGGFIKVKSGEGPFQAGGEETPRAGAVVGPADGAWTPTATYLWPGMPPYPVTVAPGEYLVFQLEDKDAEYHDKSKISRELAKAKRVRVAEGETVEVTLGQSGGAK